MRLPAVRSRKVVTALKKFGFEEKRQTGSHLILQNKESRKIITVPITGSSNVKRGTLSAIIRQSGVDVDDFLREL